MLLCFPGGEERRAAEAPAPEIDLLRPAQDERPAFGLLLRPFLTFSASEGGLGSEDVAGNVFEDLDLWAGQEAQVFAWRLQADFEDGSATLEDAWARFGLGQNAQLRVGQFKPRVVRSASIAEDALLFRARTFLGSAFDVWDDGAELTQRGERWSTTLALADGSNGSEADHFWSLRAELELYESDLAEREGARGAENFLVARWGVATFADVAQSAKDGGGLAIDLALTYGPYSVALEWAHLQDEFSREVDVFNGHVFDLGDGDPVSFTFGRRVGEELEAAFRYERAEDADDTSATRLGLNWGRKGSFARFVAEVGAMEADSRDFTILSAGVVMGASGPPRQP